MSAAWPGEWKRTLFGSSSARSGRWCTPPSSRTKSLASPRVQGRSSLPRQKQQSALCSS
ncbi:unnamed protein product [Polarella glacialis]|uniref:Uncharacterized protein n=1 Tax=Polarella glacialis TaxID=89957 RepID=A0A813LZL3_POLGL|nr:unnamed protein product [Polarella glacialis]